jgi:hypothetical protein
VGGEGQGDKRGRIEGEMKNEPKVDKNYYAYCDFCGKHNGTTNHYCDMEMTTQVNACPDCFYKAPERLKQLKPS